MTMAQGFPPPEGKEEDDHAHTPWVGVKWGFPRREGQRSCLPSYIPYIKKDGGDHGHTHPLLKRRGHMS